MEHEFEIGEMVQISKYGKERGLHVQPGRCPTGVGEVVGYLRSGCVKVHWRGYKRPISYHPLFVEPKD